MLTQISFQVGALRATLPANLATDSARRRGARRRAAARGIPVSAADLIAYLLCFAAIVAGAVRLADADAEHRSRNRSPTPNRSAETGTRDEARHAGQAADEIAEMFDGVARRYDLTNTVLSFGSGPPLAPTHPAVP